MDRDSDISACAKDLKSIATVAFVISVKHWLLKHVTIASNIHVSGIMTYWVDRYGTYDIGAKSHNQGLQFEPTSMSFGQVLRL